jgi:hypothetical protein
VSYYNGWARAFLAHLSKATGIPLIDPKAARAPGGTGEGGIDATCAQWTRCYRLPYVLRSDGPGDAYVTDPAIDLSRLWSGALAWAPKGANLTREVPAPRAGDSDHGADGAPPFPGPDDVTADEWRALSDSKYLVQMQEGKPLSKKGDRDQAMMRAIGDVVGALDTTDPSVPWRCLARAVAADTSEGAPTLEKLWDRCVYVARKQADQHAVSRMMETQPAIVFAGRGYYVWNERVGGYMPPVQAYALCHGLETYAPTLGLVTRTPTGKPRDTAEYVAAYGAPAREVVVEMGRRLTTYDRATGTLTEGCCVLRDAAPRRHAAVETWLEYLGGGAGSDTLDALLDWQGRVQPGTFVCGDVYHCRTSSELGAALAAWSRRRAWWAVVAAWGALSAALVTVYPAVRGDALASLYRVAHGAAALVAAVAFARWARHRHPMTSAGRVVLFTTAAEAVGVIVPWSRPFTAWDLSLVLYASLYAVLITVQLRDLWTPPRSLSSPS